ncbi:MAG: hypothetical protein IPF54_01800 [Draconibacterium sp.]|nr:hypothetical protein [Draconibacterium sp.]
MSGLQFIKLSVVFTYIAFIVGIIRFKYLSKELKTFFYFVAFGVLTEIYTKFHQHFIMKITNPIGHFYFPIAFLILTFFYYQLLNKFIRPIYFFIVIGVYEIYCVINPLFIQSLLEYPSLVGAIGALIVFIFSVTFFIKIMTEAKIERLSREPLIWINTAVLVYYSFNFFFFSLYNLRVIASMELAKIAAGFFGVFNLLFYSIITVGFLISKKAD